MLPSSGFKKYMPIVACIDRIEAPKPKRKYEKEKLISRDNTAFME
ncbi:hypothetical protein [Campylobacter blaseri]|nr:hypothetical protein [Campylobacter blaseri]